PADLALLRRAEANHRRAVVRRHQPCRLRALGAPAAVIPRLFSTSALLSPQGFELFPSRPATVSMAGGDQLIAYLAVARQALHLEKGPFVPVEAEPPHPLEDRVHRFPGRALEVGVLDAQDEFAAVAPRVGPREKRGARAADVEVAGRARRETCSYAHEGQDFPMRYVLPVFEYRAPPASASAITTRLWRRSAKR